MAHKRKPFWALDSESDPFESDVQAVARRSCPTCGMPAGTTCKIASKESRRVRTHEPRRRVPVPFIWGAYGGPDGCSYHEFDSVQAVVEFFEDLGHIVYAHNGGKFDYHSMKWAVNTTPNPKKCEKISIIAGRLARFKIGACEFRDSMNILPVALKTYKKDDFDYSLLEPEVRNLPQNVPVIKAYLKSDCVNLYYLVSAHREENGVTLTQAGASMRKWAKTSHTKAPRQSAFRYHQYKPYYYGGRVQCFEQGVKATPFKLYDINSAYPAAMLHPHPFSTEAIAMARWPEGKLEHCMVTLKCTAKGCFPFRLGDDPTKGDLFFPHDERTIRRYHVTGYELLAALEMDAVTNIEIETVHFFPHMVKFEDFIMDNWNKRNAAKLAGNKALDIIYKLLMNSLYGKFASDYSKYREFAVCKLDDVLAYQLAGFNIDPITWAQGMRLVAKELPEDKHRYYNIATAASITGYVRAQMFRALCTVDRPLYCDTDSIACADARGLTLGGGLGAWKFEGDFDWYAIAGKKTYAFHKAGAPESIEVDHLDSYLHWKVASKGVDLDPHQIECVARGEKILYSPDVPTYSVKRELPTFIDREVRLTARDIRRVPEVAI